MKIEGPRAAGGHDFIIKVIQYLENTFGIRFFITTKDFDVLYRWYEKRIPFPVISESIANVVERRKKKNNEITGFSNFYYEVKKNFEAFLQLNVGAGAANEPLAGEPKDEENEFAPIERFFENYPPQLHDLKEDFERVFQQVKNKEEIDLVPVHGKLTDLFKDDEELNMKVTVFTRSLAPELRKPDIENRYRLNYLLNKYKIPDFEM